MPAKVRDEIPQPLAPPSEFENPLHSKLILSGSDSPRSVSSFEQERLSFVSDTNGIPPLATVFNICLLGLNTCFVVLMQVLFFSASAFVYVPVLKMSMTWSTATTYVSSIFSIAAQIAIGYFGDKVVSRWGKRKPLLILFWPIEVIAALAIAYPPLDLDRVGVQLWYLMCTVSFQVTYVCFSSVFASWFIESCADATDYRRISTWGFTIGGASGAVLGLVCSQMRLIQAATIPAALASTITLAAVLYYVPNRVVQAAAEQPPLLSSVRILSNTSEYRTVLLNKVVIVTAQNCSMEFLFYTAFMCFPGVTHYKQLLTFYIIFAVVGATAGIPSVLTLNFLLSRGWEKIRLYMTLTQAFVGIAGVLLAIYLPGLIAGSSLSDQANWTLFWLWMATIVISSFLYSGAMFLEQLIVRDLIRFDTFRSGLNRENMYQTALGVPANIVSQFLYSVPMCIFTTTGFRTLIPPETDDLLANKYSWTFGSHIQIMVYSTLFFGGGSLAAYYWFRRYPLLQGIMTKIEQAINNREEKRQRLESARADIKFGSVAPEKPAEDDAADAVEEADSDAGRFVSAIDSGVGSIADDTDEMLMNHFSFTELRAMCISDFDDNKKSKALNRIAFYSRVNLFLICPATVAALLAGLGIQIVNNGTYTVLVVNLFCFTMVVGIYEALRVLPIAQLGGLSGMDVTLKAKAACRKLTQRQDSLKELLARSGIDADDPSGLRDTLAPPPEIPLGQDANSANFIDSGPFSGVFRSYAWVYAAQGALFVVGLLFALCIT